MIIFISKFVSGRSADESLKEDGKTLDVKREIKGWDLSHELQLQWVSFPDHYGITMSLEGDAPMVEPSGTHLAIF